MNFFFLEILETLKINCIDCNKSKRNGAALAFNNLYIILREQENICNKYFIELLHVFCLNFKLTEEFGDFLVTFQNNLELDQVSKSLSHIVRVFKQRSYIFNNKSTERIIPNGLGDGCLVDIVGFLFKECSNKLLRYRRKCMEMVETLAVQILEVSSIQVFINKYVPIPDLLQLCESEIHENPNMTLREASIDLPHIWLQHLLSSLDCYCWLLKDSSISNLQILFDEIRGYKIFEAVTHFFNYICNVPVDDVIKRYGGECSEDVAVTNEKYKIIFMKCFVINRAIDFVESVLNAGGEKYIPDSFWDLNLDALKCLMNNLISQSESLDFYFNITEILLQLTPTIENFWFQLSKFYYNELFYKTLAKYFAKQTIDLLSKTSETIKQLITSSRINKQHKNNVIGISLGIKCFKNYMKQSPELQDILKSLMLQILDNLYEGVFVEMDNKCVYTISPEAKIYTSSLIDISFLISDAMEFKHYFNEKILEFILDHKLLTLINVNYQSTRGQHFFNTFKNSLCGTMNEK